MTEQSSFVRRSLQSWCAALAAVATAAGGGPMARAEEPLSTEALAAQATDPTASLMSFQLNNWYTPSFHDIGGSSNQVVFRTALPFELAGTHHIFRLTAPYVTSSPSGADGFADLTVFDLMTFDREWGRFGIGISGTLPTGAEGLTLDKWTAGPAFGFVNSSVKRMNWGLFAQTFFSYAGDDDASDVGLVNVQPVLSYQLGKGRSLSVGNSAFVYDTENSRWSSLMLGVNYGFIVGWKGQKWRPNFEVNYDFKDDRGNQEWVLRAGVALLVPRT
jgi:hypothetical protein